MQSRKIVEVVLHLGTIGIQDYNNVEIVTGTLKGIILQSHLEQGISIEVLKNVLTL